MHSTTANTNLSSLKDLYYPEEDGFPIQIEKPFLNNHSPSHHIIERLLSHRNPKHESQKDLLTLLPSHESIPALDKRVTYFSRSGKSSFAMITSHKSIVAIRAILKENIQRNKIAISRTNDSFRDHNKDADFLMIDEDFWCKTEVLKRRFSA